MGFNLEHAICSFCKFAMRISRNKKEASKPSSKSNNNTIYVNDHFSYFGTGKSSRELDELYKINVQEADEAFKTYKKEILNVFMKENGFIKHKTNAYIRLNKIGLIEYINLQKEAHGSRTFTLNVCVLPIYVPHDVFTIGFGDRIGILVNGKDFWWDYKDLCTSEKSFENIIQALEVFIFPWFEQYNNEEKYLSDLFNGFGIIGDSRIKWIIYFYIKNDEVEKARNYLNKYLDSNDFNNKIIVNDLLKILNSSKTNEEILNEAVLYNINKYKLAKSLIKKDYGSI